MDWQELCERPELQNLPFKIELTDKGQILMSPVKVYHSAFQGKIARLLPNKGVILSECAIRTSKGTKIADVAWCSEERFKTIKDEAECSIAPEICVEILSLSNSENEMTEKRFLYGAAGASEIWICDRMGVMSFFDRQGAMECSCLVPHFPHKIKIIED